MMWHLIRIADFGTVITGKTPSSKDPKHFGEIYPFITPTDIDTNRIVATERRISEEGSIKFKRQMLPRNSVCFVCIGATIGKICMTMERSLTNQQINSIVVDKTKHDPFFVYYLLSTYAEKVKSVAGGAATPIVNKTAFENIEAIAPPLSTQHKIASILSAYDDLIENNLRRIKILEEMAQTIYREWFVKFRFPGHEKARMVDSPLGKIPEGWEVKKLGDVIELAYGKGLKKTDRIEGNVPVYGSSGVVGYHITRLVKGPGIIVGRKGNVGSVHWSNSDFFPIDTVFYVKTKLSLYYVFYNFQTQNFINTDAAVPGLSRNQAYLLSFLVPPYSILKQFEEMIKPFFALVMKMKDKIEVLKHTRDLLLPKLISGKLDISELEIETDGIVNG